MKFIDGGTYELEYEQVNKEILDVIVKDIPFIVSKGNPGYIDANDPISLNLYTLHE